jgi:hypothetical protein
MRTLDHFKLEPNSAMHVIVVRPGEEYTLYKQQYGSTHIIMRLPQRIEYRSPELVPPGFPAEVDSGCGFARLTIQVVAYLLGLDHIHVWDDNVAFLFELDVQNVCQQSKVTADSWGQPLDDWLPVLKSVERCVSDQTYLSSPISSKLESDFGLAVRQQTAKGPVTVDDRGKRALFWSEYVGKEYGVIGMLRGRRGDGLLSKNGALLGRDACIRRGKLTPGIAI